MESSGSHREDGRVSTLAERSLIEHCTLTGCLEAASKSNTPTRSTSVAHLIVPDVYSIEGSMTLPSTTGFVISKEARDIKNIKNNVNSARWEPKRRPGSQDGVFHGSSYSPGHTLRRFVQK